MKRAALLIAVLLIVAFGCSSKKPSASTQSPGSSVSTSASVSASAKASSSSRPSKGGSGSSTTSVLPSAGSSGSSSNTVVLPPTAGVYHYLQSGSTQAGSFATFDADPEGTLAVGSPTITGSGRLQKQTRQYSSDWSQDQYLLFGAHAIYLQQTTMRFSFGFVQETTCKPDHPLKVVPLPIKVGATWSDSGTCDGLKVSLTGKVLRTETRSVGGKSVATYVVKVSTHTTGDGYDLKTDVTTWLSSAYRLSVRSVTASSGTVPQGTFTQNLTENLKSVKPDA